MTVNSALDQLGATPEFLENGKAKGSDAGWVLSLFIPFPED